MNEVKMRELPLCDFHRQENQSVPATYDGGTRLGPWAFMCENHFKKYGIGLGKGRGQKLVLLERH